MKLNLSRTLLATTIGAGCMIAFCAVSLVASIVIEDRGGDGSAYMEFAKDWIPYIGGLIITGTGIHGTRHLGSGVPSGTDP